VNSSSAGPAKRKTPEPPITIETGAEIELVARLSVVHILSVDDNHVCGLAPASCSSCWKFMSYTSA